MPVHATTVMSQVIRSDDAGREVGEALLRLPTPLAAVILYSSVEHDQKALVSAVHETVGSAVPLVGCSAQGIATGAGTHEGGYFCGAVAFSGLRASAAVVSGINDAPRAKGRSLGQQLVERVPWPRLVVVLFDPITGADLGEFVAGVRDTVSCPVVGGGASQPWGPISRTFQYHGGEVIDGGAVALALDGLFEVELDASHGTEPIGIEHVITRAAGTQILELDGLRPADVWKDTVGASTDLAQMATLAIGLANEPGSPQQPYRVLSPTKVDSDTGAISVFIAVEQGMRVMLHSRSAERVLDGTRAMGRRLAERVAGRKVAAALSFECGARTGPFLGPASTRAENRELQALIAADAPWLGLFAWGELLPLPQGPALVNYTFPVACLVT